MWIHPDLVQDVQWDSKKPKSKGKSCNVISILPDDGNFTSASLSDSEGEKLACMAQADTPQQTGTRSEKSYLKQYEKSTDETQQQTTSVQVPASTTIPTKGKERPKEVRFDHVLKKPPGQGLIRPFGLTYWLSWPISQLVSLYTSSFASQKRQEKHSGTR